MPVEANARKRRILCTEDDADIREVLRLQLELEGFEVICAEDADQAIGLAAAGQFDLYLLDNWLREVSGVVLCQKLREFDSTTPILFYSGAATPADKARAIACGAQGYLTKPASAEDLLREVQRLIRRN
jgi:DNA-binding response OmpR family regulator